MIPNSTFLLHLLISPQIKHILNFKNQEEFTFIGVLESCLKQSQEDKLQKRQFTSHSSMDKTPTSISPLS